MPLTERHPWLTLSAATAAGALAGSTLFRDDDDGSNHSPSSAARSSALSLLLGLMWRQGMRMSARHVLELLTPTPHRKADPMNEMSNSNGTASSDGAPPDDDNPSSAGHLSSARERAAELVDSASTRVGTGLDAAAKSVAAAVGQATDRVGTAGQYLQNRNAGELGDDIVGIIRKHPKTALAIGFGIGFLLSRMIRR